jgi:hypothetical protein
LAGYRTWGSTNGTVALANSEQKFAKWHNFIDIFLRDLVDFSPMQQLALLHWQASGAICPSRLAGSSGEAEKSVHKAHFSRRARFLHETLPLTDHTHDLEAFDGCRCRGQRLEPPRWIDQPLERTVICL